MERRLDHMTQRLGLDANQVRLVREAMEQARTEHDALREQPRSPERRAAHQAIMQRTMERIDAVLTPAQRATFEQVRAERRERMGERGWHGRGGRGGRGQGGSGQQGGVDPRGI
jgi:periplasmic protein CpxP/Spy